MKNIPKYSNPKVVGSKIIGCVPVPGCKYNCPDCYYLRPGAFYAPADQPVFPTLEEAEGKIVRVNDGGDSNNHRNYVVEATRFYKDKFYNTSEPQFVFPSPVVFTANGHDMDRWFYAVVDKWRMIMFVRVKFNRWNIFGVVDPVVDYYTNMGIPVVLTPMRYYTYQLIKFPESYEWKKHINNAYWCIKEAVWLEIWNRYRDNSLVFSCGSPVSAYCRDCGNCEILYLHQMDRVDEGALLDLKNNQNRNFDRL